MSGVSLQYSAPVDFRIAQTPPDDIPPEYRVAFSQIYNSIQQIIRALVDNAGIGPQPLNKWSELAGSPTTLLAGNLNRLYVLASEDIIYGAAVSLFDNAGVLEVRNANASNVSKLARGFCTTLDGILNGTVGEIQLHSGVVNISGLTVGAPYFLSATDGLITSSIPSILNLGIATQFVGIAITTSALFFYIEGTGDSSNIANTLDVIAGENIVYGAAINFYDNAGVLTVRNANATNNTKPCQGFCTNAGGITTGNIGQIQTRLGNVSVTGLTNGASYFLSTTDGLIANVPAVAAGNISQFIGFAIANNVLAFNVSSWIQH